MLFILIYKCIYLGNIFHNITEIINPKINPTGHGSFIDVKWGDVIVGIIKKVINEYIIKLTIDVVVCKWTILLYII